jgi:GntR family transcriptional regulator
MNTKNSMEGDKLNIIISNSSDKPIYEQIAAQIKDGIISGELKEEEILPSIRNLARELKISVITTKRAYEELEKEGYISTVPGRGSYVAAQSGELLRESRLRIVEEKLTEAVNAAKSAGLSLPELKEMLEMFYEEVY